MFCIGKRPGKQRKLQEGRSLERCRTQSPVRSSQDTWQQDAGRSFGDDGHSFGKLTRSVFRRVMTPRPNGHREKLKGLVTGGTSFSLNQDADAMTLETFLADVEHPMSYSSLTHEQLDEQVLTPLAMGGQLEQQSKLYHEESSVALARSSAVSLQRRAKSAEGFKSEQESAIQENPVASVNCDTVESGSSGREQLPLQRELSHHRLSCPLLQHPGSSKDATAMEYQVRSAHNVERRSWQEFAGRSHGSEGYQFGDLMRGTLATIIGSATPRGGATACSVEDLEPIDKDGLACMLEVAEGGAPQVRRRRPSRDLRRRSLSTPSLHNTSAILRASLDTEASIPKRAVLGEGQYGVVWRARSSSTREWCAVKTISTRIQGEELLKREQQIAEIVFSLPHPCLVKLLTVHLHEDGSLNGLVMEFCGGGDLHQHLTRLRAAASQEGREYAPHPKAPQWIAEIFLGLEHMHLQMDLIFRDLKPGNVVFTVHGRAKITDFGLSRSGLQSTGAWTFGFPAGSPGYIAPEILEHEKYFCSADLYSLGVLMWVVQTGGARDRQEPAPPMNCLDDDWYLLEQCIVEPEKNNSMALGEPVCSLVQELIKRDPASRPSHEKVRQHTYMAPLALPPSGAAPDLLETWLSSAESVASGASSERVTP